jgi:hypothetical protein
MCLVGCDRRPVTLDEIPGTYVVNGGTGIDYLEIKSDGLYTHYLKAPWESEVQALSDTWVIGDRKDDGTLSLYFHRFGWAPWRTFPHMPSGMATALRERHNPNPRIRRSGGTLELVFVEDADLYYTKQKE